MRIQFAMKQILPVLMLLIFFASCKKSDMEYENDFNKSFQRWQDFKKSSNNSYRYLVRSGTWTGASWETRITVTGGQVTQRHFKYTALQGLDNNIPEEKLEWTEDATQINSHTGTSAAAPQTLDEIYQIARKDWLLKREEAKVYFEANNDGMISSCGYVEENCMDDCFVGITISSITPL